MQSEKAAGSFYQPTIPTCHGPLTMLRWAWGGNSCNEYKWTLAITNSRRQNVRDSCWPISWQESSRKKTRLGQDELNCDVISVTSVWREWWLSQRKVARGKFPVLHTSWGSSHESGFHDCCTLLFSSKSNGCLSKAAYYLFYRAWNGTNWNIILKELQE